MSDQVPNAAIWSALRGILIAVGGFLVRDGVLSESALQDAVGALMVLAPLIWGVVNKILAEGKIQVREHIALQAGVQAVRERKLDAYPAAAIGPSHAQELIQEAKEEQKV